MLRIRTSVMSRCGGSRRCHKHALRGCVEKSGGLSLLAVCVLSYAAARTPSRFFIVTHAFALSWF